jgi:hypothetical protein
VNKWCGQRNGDTMNGALSEPVGTQWSKRAVFRGCQDGKNVEGRGLKGEKLIRRPVFLYGVA